MDLHVPPDIELEQVCPEIERAVASENGNNTTIEVEVTFATREAGYVIAPKDQVIDALKSVFIRGVRVWKPSVFPSQSDTNQFYKAGVMPIVVGCGRLQEAHTPEEAVRFSEVVEAADLYYQVAFELLSATDE